MSSGFWTGGPAAYHKGLNQNYYARLEALRVRFEHSADEAEREKIRIEIEATQSEFKNKAADIDKMIF